MNELQRVQQVLSGNSSAFGYFVETYQHMAYTIAVRVCGNGQDAEDVVQESFVKAYRNLHTFRRDSRFSSWLYRIVYNTAVTHSRAKVWSDVTEVDEVALPTQEGTQVEALETERSEMVERVLARMPKGDAVLMTLYYLEEHAVKEVAQIMGLNESNVKVRLHRARKLFKELWLQLFGEEDYLSAV